MKGRKRKERKGGEEGVKWEVKGEGKGMKEKEREGEKEGKGKLGRGKYLQQCNQHLGFGLDPLLISFLLASHLV